MVYPHGHSKTATLVAGLRMTGITAAMVLDRPIDGDWFEPYVRQVLVPELESGDVVVMANPFQPHQATLIGWPLIQIQ